MRWRTAITDIEPGAIRIRGYSQRELMDTVPFSDVAYLVLQGDLPSEGESRLFSAVLTACVDHSVTPPSAHATRLATSGGARLPGAIASGLLAIGEHHGGAMRELQELLESIISGASDTEEIAARAGEVVDTYLAENDAIPGIGHRVHETDPRAESLLLAVAETRPEGAFEVAFRELQAALEAEVGRDLPPNVDGAIAVALAELGFDVEVSQAVFVIGRAVGLAAHFTEERAREDPMRRMGPDLDDIEYDGPEARSLPSRYRER